MSTRIPPKETHDYSGLIGMNRKDGQRLLLWTDSNIQQQEYITNILREYDKRQFIDYIVFSSHQDIFRIVAKRFHIPILDFDIDKEVHSEHHLLLLHHWRHMILNGMPSSSIFFHGDNLGEYEMFRSLSLEFHIPMEVVKLWG